LTFELQHSLRRIKPHKFTAPLRRRDKAALAYVTKTPTAGRDLLLDSCVYIDVLQGTTPAAVDALLQLRSLNHLSVCLAELTYVFGRLDPRCRETAAVLREVSRTVAAIPLHRLHAATAAVVAEAGILAGLVFRLGGFARGQEVAALNDATLYLHALAHGQVVLTRNSHDFDLMNQILPDGQVLYYDRNA
jgi:predicted nucleic acid-binding protein